MNREVRRCRAASFRIAAHNMQPLTLHGSQGCPAAVSITTLLGYWALARGSATIVSAHEWPRKKAVHEERPKSREETPRMGSKRSKRPLTPYVCVRERVGSSQRLIQKLALS